MRTMKLEVEGNLLYESFFDPATGNTIRRVAETEEWVSYGDGWGSNRSVLDGRTRQALRDKFPNRYGDATFICSPSPEIVDISITNRCNFGCEYCYQNSRPRLKHGRTDLVSTLLLGFKTVPYQIALGGGEPTQHPDLPIILKEARELGTVPNFTTNGKLLSKEVLKATNDYCGGVAMTYHTFKGFDWFRERYKALRSALTCQVNVHLIADRHVVGALGDLIRLQDEMDKAINLVLLAYDPEMGRGKPGRIMTRTMYSRDLPAALKRAMGQGMQIAYSEGLLPYFLTRPEIGIDTKFAVSAEGHFSCYFDVEGRIHQSSFNSWFGHQKTCFEISSQTLWETMNAHDKYHSGEGCYGCPHSSQCSVSSDPAYYICARAPHNKLPLETPPEPEPERRGALDRLLDEEE